MQLEFHEDVGPDGNRLTSLEMEDLHIRHELRQHLRVGLEVARLQMRFWRLSNSSIKSLFYMIIPTNEDILLNLLDGFSKAVWDQNRLFLPKAEVQRCTDIIDGIIFNLRNNNISASLNECICSRKFDKFF